VIASNVDDEIVKLRDLERVTSIFVTHQIRDAFYVANHEASATAGQITIAETAEEQATFMVLHDGRIYFEGTGAELLASTDAYLKEFLFMTLPPW
jgi:phospholipid/cholesterol/gamma-HCH transport system ATP-binding protein